MILLLAFVRTLTIGFSCVVAGGITYLVLVWISQQAGLTLSSELNTVVLLGCLLSAWVMYRLFFRQIWEKEGEEWVQK